MRGVISIVLILAMLFPLMYLAAFSLRANAEISTGKAELLRIERMNAVEQEIKNAVGGALKSAEGKNPEATALDAVKNLLQLEMALENKFAKEGIDVDLWFGACSGSEIQKLKGEIYESRSLKRCELGFDFSEKTMDYRGRFVPLATAILYYEKGELRISRKALTILPEKALAKFVSRNLMIGASLYFTQFGSSMVVAMQEGFG